MLIKLVPLLTSQGNSCHHDGSGMGGMLSSDTSFGIPITLATRTRSTSHAMFGVVLLP